MSTEAEEFQRIATRKSAELLDTHGMPRDREDALTLLALAYLQGAQDQLSWARHLIGGDS